MRTLSLLAPWIRRFLLEHLIGERNLTHNTQMSYRDTLVLLLPFVAHKTAKSLDRLTVEDIRADIVREFLLDLEQQRSCSISTRNQRLAAIHALARFIGERSPEHIVWFTEIRSIPFPDPLWPISKNTKWMPFSTPPIVNIYKAFGTMHCCYLCTTLVPGLRRLHSLPLQIWMSVLLHL